MGGVAGVGGLALALAAPLGAAPDRTAPLPRGDTEARIELGRRLFFDPLVSRTGQRACSFCHDPEHGFSDPVERSEDDLGRSRRHSQTLIDSHVNPSAHWDGELRGIEELVLARIGRVGLRVMCGQVKSGLNGANTTPPPDPTLRARAPGRSDPSERPPRLEAYPSHGAPFGSNPLDLNLLPEVGGTVEDAGRYRSAFASAFGTPAVSVQRIAEAIAAYCRSLHTTTAPIDRFLAGDEHALSEPARRGLELFRGRAGCAQCHVMEGSRPGFTDYGFHDNGVTWRSLQRALGPSEEKFDADKVANADRGREGASTSPGDRRCFKTPTLRDLPRRGPYMHDGSFKGLTGIVRHYAGGGSRDPLQDQRIRGFEATDADVADLVAFLEALNGEERPGIARRAWNERVQRTRLRFVDARRQAMAGLVVGLVPEGDVMPSGTALPTSVTTDERGYLEFAPPTRTHTRLVLPEGLLPVGGALVPDSCLGAEIQVPVDGRARFLVSFDAGEAVPERIVAEHDNPHRLIGDAAPRTLFLRQTSLPARGASVVAYEGWHRTDASDEVRVRLPGEPVGAERRVTLAADKSIRLAR
jgi:cytochrome c peroxidase